MRCEREARELAPRDFVIEILARRCLNWQAGWSDAAWFRGGDHEIAKLLACFSVSTENARKDFDASTTSPVSRAFWFVFTVATHI